MENELVLFPVTGWEIAAIPAHGLLFIRPAFLTHPLQKPDEADPGRRYLLTTDQARQMRDAIDRILHQLESGGPQGSRVPKH